MIQLIPVLLITLLVVHSRSVLLNDHVMERFQVMRLAVEAEFKSLLFLLIRGTHLLQLTFVVLLNPLNFSHIFDFQSLELH